MLLLSEKSRTACSLREQGGVVCALSGGPDSVALLLELKRLHDEGGIGPLYAAHFEHGIRGEASREDMAFCRTLCLKLQVPLFVESEDVPGSAATAFCAGSDPPWGRTPSPWATIKTIRRKPCFCT